MGELDRDLCNFWKGVASSNVTLPTSSIITFEFFEDQLDVHIGLSLSPIPGSNLPNFVFTLVLLFWLAQSFNLFHALTYTTYFPMPRRLLNLCIGS